MGTLFLLLWNMILIVLILSLLEVHGIFWNMISIFFEVPTVLSPWRKCQLSSLGVQQSACLGVNQELLNFKISMLLH